jgi:hypothetical protein
VELGRERGGLGFRCGRGGAGIGMDAMHSTWEHGCFEPGVLLEAARCGHILSGWRSRIHTCIPRRPNDFDC